MTPKKAFGDIVCGLLMNPKDFSEQIDTIADALEKLEDLKWLMENYPIRIDHYDTKNGNKDFVLGVESMREYVLDVLNGEISVDIEALKAEDNK